MNTTLITELLLEKDKDVQELAQILADIETALATQSITEQEYVSLMVDVERLRVVIYASDNARLCIMVHNAIRGVIELAKAVW